VRRFSIAAATKKIAALIIVNPQTNGTDSAPLGIARTFVRGLRASYSRSAMRLKAIAVERAPTIAIVIQTICHKVGTPRAASRAPRKAKGSANRVCSILIISSVVRTFLVSVAIELKTQSSKLRTQNCLFSLPSGRRIVRNSKLIENSEAEMIDQGFNRLWPV